MMGRDFIPHFDFAGRIRRLQRMMERKGIDACFLASSHDVDAATYYFCGDETTPTLLFLTPDFTAISSLHEKDFSHLFDECIPLAHARKRMRGLFRSHHVKKLSVDDSSSTAGSALRFQKRFPSLALVPFSEELSEMRNVKEPDELRCIERAQTLTNLVLDGIAGEYAAGKLWGKTENQVAGLLEKRVRDAGASLDAFPPMVLAGSRAAFFHNPTSNQKIERDELVLVDAGARYRAYCGDATRTWYSGKDREIRDALEVVGQSKRAAEKKVRNGILGREISDAALKVIEESGWKKHSFRAVGLSLGHFLGLRVHDGTAFEKARVKPGMAFTIEPGIYVPNRFGIRLEDVVFYRG